MFSVADIDCTRLQFNGPGDNLLWHHIGTQWMYKDHSVQWLVYLVPVCLLLWWKYMGLHGSQANTLISARDKSASPSHVHECRGVSAGVFEPFTTLPVFSSSLILYRTPTSWIQDWQNSTNASVIFFFPTLHTLET